MCLDDDREQRGRFPFFEKLHLLERARNQARNRAGSTELDLG